MIYNHKSKHLKIQTYTDYSGDEPPRLSISHALDIIYVIVGITALLLVVTSIIISYIPMIMRVHAYKTLMMLIFIYFIFFYSYVACNVLPFYFIQSSFM